jgi:hypothetical protein
MPEFFGAGEYIKSGYPDTVKTYRLTFRSPNASLEETYYWLLDNFKSDWGFPEFIKIMDVFSASEQSAFWGQAQQRLGLQQDKAQQYMATIGKMVKDLFQLVRELRILEERLGLYDKAPKSKSADVSLKGLYIDMVEGGSKNPSSVYGIAQQVGFTTLPDLFFNTHVYDPNRIDDLVDDMDFNDQVLNVLRRKLFSYLNWVDKTEDELKNRYQFTLRYLRQHWGTIRMYMNWVKPYLKNVQRMQMSEHHMNSEKLISAFETSLTEIEVLAKKPAYKKGLHPCILISIEYATQPEMNYQQEGYQHRGPIHTGEIEFRLRTYAWTEDEIENFRRLKREEDMELISIIDDSVNAAMDALGDDLRKYLEEAEEKLDRSHDDGDKPSHEGPGALDPFTSIFKGFGELFGSLGGTGLFSRSVERPTPSYEERVEILKETGTVLALWQNYKNYKKSHGMIAW